MGNKFASIKHESLLLQLATSEWKKLIANFHLINRSNGAFIIRNNFVPRRFGKRNFFELHIKRMSVCKTWLLIKYSVMINCDEADTNIDDLR